MEVFSAAVLRQTGLIFLSQGESRATLRAFADGNWPGRTGVAAISAIHLDKAGKFRFRLKASNGQIIAVGEAYDSKAAAQNGIASVQKNTPDATVVDLTE